MDKKKPPPKGGKRRRQKTKYVLEEVSYIKTIKRLRGYKTFPVQTGSWTGF
jgi:hypothetical protein